MEESETVNVWGTEALKWPTRQKIWWIIYDNPILADIVLVVVAAIVAIAMLVIHNFVALLCMVGLIILLVVVFVGWCLGAFLKQLP